MVLLVGITPAKVIGGFQEISALCIRSDGGHSFAAEIEQGTPGTATQWTTA